MAKEYDIIECCDGAGTLPPGPTANDYSRARTGAGTLANVYLRTLDIDFPLDGYFFLYNPDDAGCYKVDPDDATTTAPGNIIDGWEDLTNTPGFLTRLCAGQFDYIQARRCVATYDNDETLEGNTSSTTVWYNGNTSLPAGTYELSYVTGAFNDDTGMGNRWTINESGTEGFFIVDNTNTNVIQTPGPQSYYVDRAATEAAYAGAVTTFVWGGGELGLKLRDGDFSNNGSASPRPTFRLRRITNAADSTVDLWRLAGITLPYFFSVSGVKYYFDVTSPVSTSPGTILTGETVESAC